jgi:hypothetical protein
MKKLLLILQLSLIACYLLAQPIAYDGFSEVDVSGGDLPLHNTNTGFGFGEPVTVQDSNQDFKISDDEPLTFSNLAVGTNNNYCYGGGSYKTTSRDFDLAVDGAFKDYIDGGKIGKHGTTLWFSALIRKKNNNDEKFELAFSKGSNGHVFAGHLFSIGFFGNDSKADGKRYWSIKVMNNTVTRTNVEIIPGETYLVVLKLDFNATTTATLYINPETLGGTAPVNHDIQVTTTNAVNIQSLAFRQGTSTNQGSLDEIRFGATYKDVTPVAAALTTDDPANVTPTSADIGGEVTAGSHVSDRGVEWKIDGGVYAAESSGAGTGDINYNLPTTPGATYHYRAYAVTGHTGTDETIYGDVKTFTAPPNTPGAPTVDNPTTNSLDVTIDQNSNGANVQYAIMEETTGKYLSAGKTLTSDNAVWQTAATWGAPITVTGLTAGTTYTFKVKAKAGTEETGFSPATSQNTSGPVAFSLSGSSEEELVFEFTAADGSPNVTLEYSSDGPGGPWTDVPGVSLDGSSTQATVTGLTPETKYWFRINVDGGINAGNSEVIEKIFGLKPPEVINIYTRAGSNLIYIVLTKDIVNLDEQANGDFTVTVNGSDNPVTSIYNGSIVLVLQDDIEEGDNVTVSYGGPGLESADGGVLGAGSFGTMGASVSPKAPLSNWGIILSILILIVLAVVFRKKIM